MTRIFINYRRGDTKDTASRLCEWLAGRYGDDQVFMDVDDIAPGRPWREAIDRAVGSSDLVLAVIGTDWLPELNRRLAEEEDFVRRELEAALLRGVSVIPVLTEGTRMPRSDELPRSLAVLPEYQAFELLGRYQYDKQELLKSVDRALKPERRPWLQPLKNRVRHVRRSHVAVVGGLGVIAGVTAVALILASGGSHSQLWVGQEPIRNLHCPSDNCSQPSLAPDGARMAFIGRKSGSIYVAEMKGALSSGGTPVESAKNGIRPSLDSTGRVVFRNQPDQHIYYTNPSQQNAQPLTARGYSDPVWSPDGTQVAYVSTTGANGSLLKIDVPLRGKPVELTRTRGAKISVPAWSPDGTRIAFVRSFAHCPEQGDIWILNAADGSGAHRLLQLSGDERHPTWSPDSKQIAFSSNVADPRNYDLYTVDADGSDLAQRTTDAADEVGPSWGASGIVYARGSFNCGGGSNQELWLAQPGD